MKKSKVTEQSKKIDWLSLAPFLCAFIIPIFIMIGIFVERGIFPFGDSSFLRTDLYHQYAPFFQTLKDKLANGGSLSYTWELGMGTNYAALFAYYLSSPLNWLLAFCPQKYVIEFITYMIVLKIGLSGLTFTYYLSKRNNTKNIGIAFFGIFYALSGYMAAYSWNIMWLDCILLFPLIILGIDRLVKEDKCMLYCLTLGLSIISNYYISIMICIYLVIYFIVSMILLPSKEKKTIHLADGT
ncbi:MAG: YfhO family protein, partial [Lachnospiraceae bacterium]